jgi:hypothetical protein
MNLSHVVALAGAVFLASSVANAQSPASNKAFYASATDELTVVNVGVNNSPVTLLDIPAALKTSSVGGVSAIVSIECSLWTFNTVTSTSGAGKNTTSSRAAIKVWVEVDGQPANPGQVVYCDRTQAVGLAVDLTCTVPGVEGCTVGGTVTIDLFQKTKEANSFTFFAGPLSPIIHSVKVLANGLIECWSSSTGQAITCPTQVVANFENEQTQALIGKRAVLVEEQNNFGLQ